MSFQKTFRQTIAIHASISKVWDALTQPELMKQWLFESEIEVVAEWKAGGSIVFTGDLHGLPFRNTGTILQFEKEKVLQYDYHSDLSKLPDRPDAIVEFKLRQEGDRTQLQFTCSEIANDVIAGHLRMYWITTLDILQKMLEA